MYVLMHTMVPVFNYISQLNGCINNYTDTPRDTRNRLLTSITEVPCNTDVHTLHWVADMDTAAVCLSGCMREASTMMRAQPVHVVGTTAGLQPLVNTRLSIKKSTSLHA